MRMSVSSCACEKKPLHFHALSIQILRISRPIDADFVAMESEVFETQKAPENYPPWN